MTDKKNYLLRQNYFSPTKGWVGEEEILEGFTYEEAAREASKAAHSLDAEHGDSHHWNVFLKNPETGGAYFELFHGRHSA